MSSAFGGYCDKQRHQSKARHGALPGSGFTAYPRVRGLVSSGPPYQRNKWIGRVDGWAVLALTLLAAFTRLYRIGRRATVTWDESHFGKFGAYYINRTFYHDVHPPLAKMLIGLAEYLAGHNGTFRFKGPYPSYVNYTFMRCFVAVFGIGIVPLAYATCHQLNMSRRACVLAALFVTFDNGLTVMSRFILLDPPLLFFTAAALLSVSGLQNIRHRAFSCAWWRWLLLTGASLGAVTSSKWVGALSVALVGLYTIEELFTMYVDIVPTTLVAKHLAARIACLIVLPLAIYAACFKVHFAVLNRSGPGDAKMPPAFQASLRGSPLSNQPFTVAYDSQLTLRSLYPGAGLLHSHPYQYPEGSRQQQVTCYGHKDTNNNWVIIRPGGGEVNATTQPPVPVRDGDIVGLMHKQTKGMLHSHRAHAAPVTKNDYEVTVYGKPDWTDRNNEWRVEIVSEQSKVAPGELHTIMTQFNLRHVSTGCLLSSASARLPQWGFRQVEVTCSRKAAPGAQSALWVVERNLDSRLPKVNMRSMVKRNFFHDFIRINSEMARTNNALVPDRDKYNHLESGPLSWPLLLHPMRMLGRWKEGEIKYYEVGNPLLWWSSTLCCVLFPLQLLVHLARKKRGMPGAWEVGEEMHYWNGAKLLWFGWLLHFAPFLAMGRVLYIHHYLPAVYFALLLLAFEIDYVCRRLLQGRLQDAVFVAWAGAAVLVFWWFSPLTFGYEGAMEDLKYRQLLSTWNIYEDKNPL
ncbi:Protein O-mannosyltransferase 2 [Coemansia sp. RSA 552]|nr:Protein O-mannosyltransferase 2 [Coemansia sp. RSA 552]